MADKALINHLLCQGCRREAIEAVEQLLRELTYLRQAFVVAQPDVPAESLING